jgi:hypothetical protein
MFLYSVDRAYIRVAQRGCGARLAFQTLASSGLAGKPIVQEFESYVTAEAWVLGLEDDTHAAAAERS